VFHRILRYGDFGRDLTALADGGNRWDKAKEHNAKKHEPCIGDEPDHRILHFSFLTTDEVFIAASSGGLYSGDSPAKAFEHSVSHLTGVLAHMGLKDVTVIRAEGVAMGPEARQNAVEKAHRAIGESFTNRLAA
jgi:hypothetical protein